MSATVVQITLLCHQHCFQLCNSYMVCLPVPGDNPQALVSALSLVQADKPWYKYFILPSSLKTLPSMLKFAIPGDFIIVDFSQSEIFSA